MTGAVQAPGPVPAGDLGRWLRGQAGREQAALRLEDALLGDRYARYFSYRLRYFVARTVIAAVVHAIRVALLFGAFAQDQFLLVVLAGAIAGVVGDAWWGALERMRARIRTLQQRGTAHLAPREIAAWLRLATRLSALGLGLTGLVATWAVLVSPDGLGAADLMVVAIVAGASLELTVRTYHSGVYALRRIYRPLPSLVVVDVVSLGVLLGLWPVIGLWAFPAAEIASLTVVMGISLRYTSRTYRAMGFPAFPVLLLMPVERPSARVLRGALAPALAYATVGLEALVLLLVVAAAGPASGSVGASMVALLAALGPIIRAGFEWARLLYFDLVRLGLPLLADLRRRFDRGVLRLAVVVGLITWLVASLIGVAVLGVRDPALFGVLLPFFVARSVLAAAQMRAFAGGAYRRLTLVGTGGLATFGLVLLVVPSVEGRMLALATVLVVSAALLIALPDPEASADRVLPLAAWLRSLAAEPGLVRVTFVVFDARSLARGVSRERRASEAWRRHQVARRVGRAAQSAGGRATWLTATDLAWWVPERPGRAARAPADALADPAWVARLTGGLVMAPPDVEPHPDGRTASRAVGAGRLSLDLRIVDPPPDALIAAFAARFPAGIVYRVDRPTPAALAALDSRERAGVLRAGLRFARDLRAGGRDRGRFDVTALVVAGSLRLLFLAPVTDGAVARRQWREAIRDRTLRAAILR